MPTWNQRQAFRKKSNKDRYPDLWEMLKILDVGVVGDSTMIDTIELLAIALWEEREARQQLEIEADFGGLS